MEALEFDALSYRAKLIHLNQRGKIVRTFTKDDFQITIYSLDTFYVEMKRRSNRKSYDWIVTKSERNLTGDIEL